MIKVGIEVPDQNFSGIDLSQPELGNPGVGGSEYLFTLLASQLIKNGLDVIVYHYSSNSLPIGLHDSVLGDSESMISKAEADGVDILIHQVGKTKNWYNRLENSKICSVAWAHVYLDYYELQILRKNQNVKRVVFVGKEEYDSYIDDDIISKSTYIYNMVPIKEKVCNRIIDVPIVTYVGSLVPAKGFHRLAQIWPEVISKVPNAELYVIGNGKVYDRNAKLGKYGISQSDYENQFMKYLTDDEGEILQSVHFCGIVGKEKRNIFKKTCVGIVNPTALTETFCLSAVEMEYSYVPVVTRKKWGLLDTVKNKKTGFLFNTKGQFLKKVVLLLKNEKLNNKMGENGHAFVKESFAIENIIPEWLILLENIENNKAPKYLGIQGNWTNDWKWLKCCLRFLRFDLGLKKMFSFYDIKNKLKTILKNDYKNK